MTTNPHPFSKARRHKAAVPVGGADANPIGFGNVNPQISTDISICVCCKKHKVEKQSRKKKSRKKKVEKKKK